MRKTSELRVCSFALLLVIFSISFGVQADVITVAGKANVPFKLAKGVSLYNKNCARCHGNALQGSKTGPPFMHPFYKASHHGDSSFYRAALKGVRAHHWKFGNMPPVEGMTMKKMDAIIPYIRWFQRENGL